VPHGGSGELKHSFSRGQREAISFAQNIAAQTRLSYFCSPHWLFAAAWRNQSSDQKFDRVAGFDGAACAAEKR